MTGKESEQKNKYGAHINRTIYEKINKKNTDQTSRDRTDGPWGGVSKSLENKACIIPKSP